MASNGSYSITVKVVDNTTAAIARINKRIVELRRPIDNVQRSFRGTLKELQRFGQLTKITPVIKGITRLVTGLTAGVANLAKTFAKVGVGILGLGAIGSVAGIVGAIGRFSEYNKVLRQTAFTADMAAGKLESWQLAYEYLGGDKSQFASSMQSLNAARREALLTGNDSVGQQWGVTGKNAEEAFPQIIDALHRMKGEGKSAATMQDFLSRMGLSSDMLAPLLAGNFQEAMDKTKGSRMWSPENAKSAEELQHSLTLAHQAADKLANSVSATLAPSFSKLLNAVTPLINKLSDWMDKEENRKWATDKLNEYVTRFTDWLNSIRKSDMDDFVAGLKEALTFAKALADAVTGIVDGVKFLRYGVTTDPANWPVASPLWRDMSEEEQAKYANSPYNEHLRDEDHSPFMNWLLHRNDVQGTGNFSRSSVNQNMYDAATELRGLGVPPNSIAAILGNVSQESSFSPLSRNDSGHLGMFQWSKDRQERIFKLTGKHIEEMNAKEQTAAAMAEMQKFYPDVYRRLMANDVSLDEATKLMTEKFEAPGNYDVENPARLDNARRILPWITPPGTTAPASPINPEPVKPPVEPLSPLTQNTNGSVDVNVAFLGFPPGQFRTSTSASGVNLNTGRTAGPLV